jgi:hypothetical protein
MLACCFHGLVSCALGAGITPKKVASRLVGSARDDFMVLQNEPCAIHSSMVLLRQFQRKHDRNAVSPKHFCLGVDLPILMDQCAAVLAEAKLVEVMLHKKPTFLESVRLERHVPSESHEPHELWTQLKALQSVSTGMLNSKEVFQRIQKKFEDIRVLPVSEFDDGESAEVDVEEMIVEKMQELVWPFVSAVVKRTPGQDQFKECARQLVLALDSKPMVSKLQSKRFLIMVWRSWRRAHVAGRLNARVDCWMDVRHKHEESLLVAAFKCWAVNVAKANPATGGWARAHSAKCLQAYTFKCWSTGIALAKHQVGLFRRGVTLELVDLSNLQTSSQSSESRPQLPRVDEYAVKSSTSRNSSSEPDPEEKARHTVSAKVRAARGRCTLRTGDRP